jgi:hypothetical protein
MSYFLKQLAQSGFIQQLRSQMKEQDLEEFDQMVKKKLQEYDELWTKIEPTVTNMNRRANDVDEENQPESSDESRFDDKPDNEQS